jgi:hypothetical protein
MERLRTLVIDVGLPGRTNRLPTCRKRGAAKKWEGHAAGRRVMMFSAARERSVTPLEYDLQALSIILAD